MIKSLHLDSKDVAPLDFERGIMYTTRESPPVTHIWDSAGRDRVSHSAFLYSDELRTLRAASILVFLKY